MQFLLIAHDGSDPEAPHRRQQARAAHLLAAAELRRAGHFIIGGALLDASGAMVGSAIVFEFPDRTALDRYLATDPYVSGKVWQQIEIHAFRVAQLPPLADAD